MLNKRQIVLRIVKGFDEHLWLHHIIPINYFQAALMTSILGLAKISTINHKYGY